MARYRVNSDQGINVRDQPGGSRIGGLANGAVVEHIGKGTQSEGGYTWIKVKAEQGGLEGWAAKEFLTMISRDTAKGDRPDDQAGSQSHGDSQSGEIGGAAGVRGRIIAAAATREGIPYLMPPDQTGQTSLDCSLFIGLTFRDAGVPFPGGIRTAQQIREACDEIDSSEVQPGDLLFFQNTYDAGAGVASHVGISLGTGTRKMWDCHAFPGDSGPPGVGITDISVWWPDYWLAAGRPRQLK
jgi:cell wall-associated NlpC family hydrolase